MMWPVDGQTIQIYPNWSGAPNETRYAQVSGSMGTTQGETANFDDQEMCYIRPNPTTDTPYGYGPLEIAARSISRQLGVGEFAGNLASNSSPSNILWPGKASDLEIRKFRRFWREEIEGQGVLPIIGGAEEPKAIKLHGGSDEALYLKWQEFLLHEIATAFDLSAQNVGAQVSADGKGSEVSESRDFQHAIRPTAKVIQSRLTRDTLNRRMGFSQLQFVFDGLDREDERELAEIYKIYYQNNLLVPNEFRQRKLGMEPSMNDWADKSYGDMQMAIGQARRGTDGGSADLLDNPDTVKKNQAAPNRTYPSRG
jgi:phage portal protein BeeE